MCITELVLQKEETTEARPDIGTNTHHNDLERHKCHEEWDFLQNNSLNPCAVPVDQATMIVFTAVLAAITNIHVFAFDIGCQMNAILCTYQICVHIPYATQMDIDGSGDRWDFLELRGDIYHYL